MYKVLSRTFVKYVSSTLFGSLIGIFSGFFTYKYIEPSILGIWALFTVYEIYATFSRLGIINGLGRELPYILGRNQTKKAKELASSALFYTILSNILLLIFIPVFLMNERFNWHDINYQLAFYVMLLRLLFSSYTSYLSVTFRTSSNFDSLTRIQNILSLVRLASLFLVVFFSFKGLLFRELILSLLEMLLFHIKRPMKICPKFRVRALVELFKIGFPLFLTSYTIGFVDTFPRLYIIHFGDIEELGLFSPIVIMLGLAILLPNAISSYMYPKMSFEFGRSNDRRELWNIVKFTALSSFVSGIPLFLAVYLFSDLIIEVFPKYESAIPYIKISSFSLLFTGYKSGGLSFSVLKSWWAMILNAAVYLVISFLAIWILRCYSNDSLFVASWSLVITYCVMFFFSLGLSYFITNRVIENAYT